MRGGSHFDLDLDLDLESGPFASLRSALLAQRSEVRTFPSFPFDSNHNVVELE